VSTSEAVSVLDVSDDGVRTFRTSAVGYDSHIGRYNSELARGLIAAAGVQTGDRVLDVGCGTGLLTAELAKVVGAGNVTAVDPSEPFVAACKQRVPGADVRLAHAEDLPLAAASVDRSLSQLVLNFISEPLAGVKEMRRVTAPGGTVAACVWDYAGEMTMLRLFWDAATSVDPPAAALDEGRSMPYCQPDELRALWTAAGLTDVVTGELNPSVRYTDFNELWTPFEAGAGPSGAYTVSLDDAKRAAVRAEFYRLAGSPAGAFELTARAWSVRGRV
jgi:SAM-dependent methyltransferase